MLIIYVAIQNVVWCWYDFRHPTLCCYFLHLQTRGTQTLCCCSLHAWMSLFYLPWSDFSSCCAQSTCERSFRRQKVITLTLVRSWTASNADLYAVLLANWKPQTSTCSQTFKLHHHRSTSKHSAYEAQLTLSFYCHSQQRADALSSPCASETCVPCLCSSELPQSDQGDQQQKSTQNPTKTFI